ncbi:aromatic-ring-hydroxylating dioxygenase subunit beta [Massilia niastensis]|uniref:aromatic-ring-hydroxylating dioxygenase subunit beta n=1 Tax=Massilia niastensis TaxID=544911 RepID=UPI000684A0E0|nr:aromatic-ring-hydroxylating dioxygenase subunit beta [Massilia niastensis]
MTNLNIPAADLTTPLGRAIAFIWQEAELLDRKDYDAWGALWSADGYYVVPIDPDTTDFASQLNYAYDDARMRQLRIERFTSGYSMSAADAAVTVRTVSRFTLTRSEGDEVDVQSAQLLAAYKRGATALFAGNLTHRIRFTAEGPKLVQKVVRLVNSQDALNALGFLL